MLLSYHKNLEALIFGIAKKLDIPNTHEYEYRTQETLNNIYIHYRTIIGPICNLEQIYSGALISKIFAGLRLYKNDIPKLRTFYQIA